MIPKAQNLAITVLLCVAIVIGILSYKDFGIATDEPINRTNGAVSSAYVVKTINSFLGTDFFATDSELSRVTTELKNYPDRDYGVAFDLPLFITERLLAIDDSRVRYQYRHLATFFFFLLGVFCLYKLVLSVFLDWRYAIIAALMVLINPRLFAESFYNGKDIAFMSIFMISLWTLWKLIEKPTTIAALFHAFITAMAIDIRVVAIMVPAATIFILAVKAFRDANFAGILVKSAIIYLVSSAIFIIILWPWLWTAPLIHFIQAIQNMSRFRWDGWILFNGNLFPARSLPPSYLLTWILITTPMFYLLLAFAGAIKIFIESMQILKKRTITDRQIFSIVVVMLFCAPLGAVIILKSVIYDGWRQFYFLYGLLIIIAMNGLEYISSIKKHHKIVSLILIISLIIQISTLITWMYRNHPFQNVYFNALAADDWHQKYEMDYWGLSDVRALEHIVSEDPRPNIKVWSLGHTSVPAALKFMGPQAQSKLAIVDQISDADYVVYNYRDVHPSAAMIFSGLIANAEVFYEIKVDGHAIITVFKQ